MAFGVTWCIPCSSRPTCQSRGIRVRLTEEDLRKGLRFDAWIERRMWHI